MSSTAVHAAPRPLQRRLFSATAMPGASAMHSHGGVAGAVSAAAAVGPGAEKEAAGADWRRAWRRYALCFALPDAMAVPAAGAGTGAAVIAGAGTGSPIPDSPSSTPLRMLGASAGFGSAPSVPRTAALVSQWARINALIARGERRQAVSQLLDMLQHTPDLI